MQTTVKGSSGYEMVATDNQTVRDLASGVIGYFISRFMPTAYRLFGVTLKRRGEFKWLECLSPRAFSI